MDDRANDMVLKQVWSVGELKRSYGTKKLVSICKIWRLGPTWSLGWTQTHRGLVGGALRRAHWAKKLIGLVRCLALGGPPWRDCR